ncbi:hypothetical protein BATDEDRAFT_25120 [Batrachochytrium dendrobatidis JAM81]|uniref:Iron-binding zinc finger CDGSH type domain-containing protein n=1 Tax=Batrachochytrium dendrobatidis (strain JAM81 / FGSC 10211) TaxID=684364 RepID=F4P2N8_BATDJ|nr:uncharacterized protein BATDEDRAFT_25120 [Batrachochytrium dendrobatidis JAM81]EGF80243.1 hypothetical protein BATDEDRAFT_25120 [Batrachochytrium dendrobatidis JAM81]|eukprot:XP_006679025.1 hypothetical protein BATDEDRAFT_25120 [Batrachochytrium dendrobatidis JAM81]
MRTDSKPILVNLYMAWFMFCCSNVCIVSLYLLIYLKYSPVNIKNIKVGSVYQWCTCGLSKTQPWCDNTHIGTGFKPLKWIAPGTKKDGKPQQIYSICACKYTTDPPYCDASHIHLPMQYIKAQRECIKDHANIKKMCTACGFKASELKANEPSGST